jgi:hypothetical protein
LELGWAEQIAASALTVVISNELDELVLCTRENVEAAYEQGLPVDLGGELLALEMTAKDSKGVAIAEGTALEMLSRHALGSPSVDDHQLTSDPTRLAQESATIIQLEQSVDVGSKDPVNRPVGEGQLEGITSNDAHVGGTGPKDPKCGLALIKGNTPSPQIPSKCPGPGTDLDEACWHHRSEETPNLPGFLLDLLYGRVDSKTSPVSQSVIERT